MTPPSPSPLLLALLRADPDGPAALRAAWEGGPQGPPDDAAQQALVAAAARHRLLAWLAGALSRGGLALAPPLAAALADAARAQAHEGLRVRALLGRALDALAREGVECLLLKGHGLGERLWAAPLERPSMDVDLLVAPEALPRAEAALRGLGLVPLESAVDAYRRAHHHHLDFSGPAGTVELHFRALTGFGAELAAAPLLGRSTPARTLGRPVRYLAPEDELLYLAVHATQHLLGRLPWLVDLQRLVRAHPGLDWAALAARARAARLHGPAFHALSAAARVLGAPVPPAALAALAPARWQVRLGARLFTDAGLVHAGLPGRKWAAYAATTLLSSGPQDMARHAVHHTLHAGRRALALRLPRLTPGAWRG